MGVIQVQLPDHLQDLVDREVAEGTVASQGEFLVEAARRYAEELAFEAEIAAEAEAGIADARLGRSLPLRSFHYSAATTACTLTTTMKAYVA